VNCRMLLGVSLCAAFPGCFIGAGDGSGPGPGPVGVDSGSLVLDWSIDGTTDPDQCDQGAASAIDISITTANGSSAVSGASSPFLKARSAGAIVAG